MLEFRDVSIGYRSKKVVGGVNLTLRNGQVVTIVGKNGAGKSTLLKSIFGFSSILSGEIFLGGKSIQSLNSSVITQSITPLFANNSVSPELRVKDIINFSIDRRCLSEQSKEVAKKKYCELFNISHFLEKRVSEISDGMLQRAMITRAFCLDTPFVFLDEPTTYLDIDSQIEISNIISNIITSENKGAIINTHNSLWVKKFSQNIFEIIDGDFRKTNLDSLKIPDFL
jgi:iron complex transport system ATP-binding protein